MIDSIHYRTIVTAHFHYPFHRRLSEDFHRHSLQIDQMHHARLQMPNLAIRPPGDFYPDSPWDLLGCLL